MPSWFLVAGCWAWNECSLLEIQKLGWFLQRSIERYSQQDDPLDFQFVAQKYGPSADKLDQLLDNLDGSYLHCEKRISDAAPSDVIWFNDDRKAFLQTYLKTDATLAEINPLVITGDKRLVAVDGKIVLDDNALYRHADLAEMRDQDAESTQETEARKYGLSYVKLDGEIGCMVNGAGLAMGTMDIVSHFGGSPANFLDIGGGAQADKVTAALRIILSDTKVKAILINIFGGITRCDEVARGILVALKELQTTVPMVVRLVGTNEAEGRQILADANLITATSLADAAKKSVTAAKEQPAAKSQPAAKGQTA